MNRTDPWYVSERSMAIASLLFSSKKGLYLRQTSASNDDGIDMLVEIRQGEKETLRLFGVQVNGCYSLPPEVEAGAISFTDSIPCFKEFSDVYLPLCALLIDVRKNEGGFFSWFVEPTVEAGEPKLIRHSAYHWVKIDHSTVDSIVAKVKEWYDTQQVTAKA